MSDRLGWFADISDPDDEDHIPTAPWRAYLQVGYGCLPLRVWFTSKADCERFIRDEVVGKDLLEDQP